MSACRCRPGARCRRDGKMPLVGARRRRRRAEQRRGGSRIERIRRCVGDSMRARLHAPSRGNRGGAGESLSHETRIQRIVVATPPPPARRAGQACIAADAADFDGAGH